MATREEIRAGVIVNIVMACPEMLNKDIEALADKILKDEDTQGVVIKIDSMESEVGEPQTLHFMAVEPLIEEEK